MFFKTEICASLRRRSAKGEGRGRRESTIGEEGQCLPPRPSWSPGDDTGKPHPAYYNVIFWFAPQ